MASLSLRGGVAGPRAGIATDSRPTGPVAPPPPAALFPARLARSVGGPARGRRLERLAAGAKKDRVGRGYPGPGGAGNVAKGGGQKRRDGKGASNRDKGEGKGGEGRGAGSAEGARAPGTGGGGAAATVPAASQRGTFKPPPYLSDALYPDLGSGEVGPLPPHLTPAALDRALDLILASEEPPRDLLWESTRLPETLVPLTRRLVERTLRLYERREREAAGAGAAPRLELDRSLARHRVALEYLRRSAAEIERLHFRSREWLGSNDAAREAMVASGRELFGPKFLRWLRSPAAVAMWVDHRARDVEALGGGDVAGAGASAGGGGGGGRSEVDEETRAAVAAAREVRLGGDDDLEEKLRVERRDRDYWVDVLLNHRDDLARAMRKQLDGMAAEVALVVAAHDRATLDLRGLSEGRERFEAWLDESVGLPAAAFADRLTRAAKEGELTPGVLLSLALVAGRAGREARLLRDGAESAARVAARARGSVRRRTLRDLLPSRAGARGGPGARAADPQAPLRSPHQPPPDWAVELCPELAPDAPHPPATRAEVRALEAAAAEAKRAYLEAKTLADLTNGMHSHARRAFAATAPPEVRVLRVLLSVRDEPRRAEMLELAFHGGPSVLGLERVREEGDDLWQHFFTTPERLLALVDNLLAIAQDAGELDLPPLPRDELDRPGGRPLGHNLPALGAFATAVRRGTVGPSPATRDSVLRSVLAHAAEARPGGGAGGFASADDPGRARLPSSGSSPDPSLVGSRPSHPEGASTEAALRFEVRVRATTARAGRLLDELRRLEHEEGRAPDDPEVAAIRAEWEELDRAIEADTQAVATDPDAFFRKAFAREPGPAEAASGRASPLSDPEAPLPSEQELAEARREDKERLRALEEAVGTLRERAGAPQRSPEERERMLGLARARETAGPGAEAAATLLAAAGLAKAEREEERRERVPRDAEALANALRPDEDADDWEWAVWCGASDPETIDAFRRLEGSGGGGLGGGGAEPPEPTSPAAEDVIPFWELKGFETEFHERRGGPDGAAGSARDGDSDDPAASPRVRPRPGGSYEARSELGSSHGFPPSMSARRAAPSESAATFLTTRLPDYPTSQRRGSRSGEVLHEVDEELLPILRWLDRTIRTDYLPLLDDAHLPENWDDAERVGADEAEQRRREEARREAEAEADGSR